MRLPPLLLGEREDALDLLGNRRDVQLIPPEDQVARLGIEPTHFVLLAECPRRVASSDRSASDCTWAARPPLAVFAQKTRLKRAWPITDPITKADIPSFPCEPYPAAWVELMRSASKRDVACALPLGPEVIVAAGNLPAGTPYDIYEIVGFAAEAKAMAEDARR